MILISQAFGSGFPARNALNSENDLAGFVDGAVCEAPLCWQKIAGFYHILVSIHQPAVKNK